MKRTYRHEIYEEKRNRILLKKAKYYSRQLYSRLNEMKDISFSKRTKGLITPYKNMTRPTDSSHMDMRTRILSCIDKKIEETIKYGIATDEAQYFRIIGRKLALQELRSEVEKEEDKTLIEINKMIEEHENTKDTAPSLIAQRISALQELKSRLYPPTI